MQEGIKEMSPQELKQGAAQLVEIIDAYTIVSRDILAKVSHPNRQLTYQTRTLIMLLERITYNSLSIKLNLNEYIRSGNQHYEYPTGLLFRNICSDIITLCYFIHLEEERKFTTEQVEAWTKDFLAKEIITAVKYFKIHEKRDAHLTYEEKEEKRKTYFKYCKVQADSNPDLLKLDENGELTKVKEDYIDEEGFEFKGYECPKDTVNLTTDMIGYIQNYLKFLKHLDVLWKGYCQYEHLGGLTYDLTRQKFQTKIHDMSHSLYNVIFALLLWTKTMESKELIGKEYCKRFLNSMEVYKKYFPLKHIEINCIDKQK